MGPHLGIDALDLPVEGLGIEREVVVAARRNGVAVEMMDRLLDLDDGAGIASLSLNKNSNNLFSVELYDDKNTKISSWLVPYGAKLFFDNVDGPLARARGEESRLGRFF